MKATRSVISGALLLSSLLAQSQGAAPVDARTRLRTLQKEQQTITAEWQAVQAAAKIAEDAPQEGKQQRAVPTRPDLSALRAKFLAAAKDYTGDDQARFLVEAYRIGDQPKDYEEVMDLLLADHLQSRELAKLGPMFAYFEDHCSKDYGTKALAKIEKESKQPAVQGWVVFAKSVKILDAAEPKSAEFQDAKKLLVAASDKSGDKNLQRQVASKLADKETFCVGAVAPELEGKDLNDVERKLSDARGKVTLVYFWVDWSAPCREFYVQGNDLMAEMKGKPFVLFGISGDTPERAKQVALEQKLAWHSLQNKRPGKPDIADDWAVQGWPTLMVLDADGKICYRGHDTEAALTVAREQIASMPAKK
jgi:peroxiredoxin